MSEIVINKIDNIKIEQINQNHIAALQQIGRQTFSETFAESNSAENMAKYLEEAYSYEKLSAELNDPNSLFYFAMMGQDVIGYLKLNFGASQTELKDNDALEIERIYMLKSFQGKRVGQLLFDKAIQIAKEQNAEFVWLGVWEENKKAIQFYTRNGFVEFDQHVFVLGNEAQTDIMMKLQLR
jgi:ribosomal protein S18 acetylase RimI-like enzyme